MRKYEKQQITREENRLVEQTCDLCGSKAEIPNYRWESGPLYHYGNTVSETEIRYKWGQHGPEDGNGKEIVVDLCPKCFVEKLVPWLESQGAKVTEKEWDY